VTRSTGTPFVRKARLDGKPGPGDHLGSPGQNAPVLGYGVLTLAATLFTVLAARDPQTDGYR